MHHAFAPLVCGKPNILILGTFPSPASREKGEYYGNPQNKFWNIVFDVFSPPGAEFCLFGYDEKKKFLFANHIALWDVITQCDIVGSSDSAIKNPAYNAALPEFIRRNGISRIAFNGRKAHELYRKGIGAIDGIVLPSTSPANARLRYCDKLSAWADGIGPNAHRNKCSELMFDKKD